MSIRTICWSRKYWNFNPVNNTGGNVTHCNGIMTWKFHSLLSLVNVQLVHHEILSAFSKLSSISNNLYLYTISRSRSRVVDMCPILQGYFLILSGLFSKRPAQGRFLHIDVHMENAFFTPKVHQAKQGVRSLIFEVRWRQDPLSREQHLCFQFVCAMYSRVEY